MNDVLSLQPVLLPLSAVCMNKVHMREHTFPAIFHFVCLIPYVRLAFPNHTTFHCSDGKCSYFHSVPSPVFKTLRDRCTNTLAPILGVILCTSDRQGEKDVIFHEIQTESSAKGI